MTKYWLVLVIFFAGGLVLLWRLGQGSLDSWDEAIYAQISKEAVEGGNWWTLHWGFKPYLRKPPIFMWTTAVLYEVFGVSEFWARAASAFSGIALLLIVYFLAKQIYDKWVGLFAVAILLTSYQYVASSRFGTTDIMLTLFTYVAVYAYLRQKASDARWWYVIWISCSLAVMTKSAAGAFAFAAIIVSLGLDKSFKATVSSRHFWFGLLAALVIVIPWHISMYAQHGQAFIDQYFGHSIIERSTSVLDRHYGDRYYYIDRLQKYFFPWVYLAPFAISLTIKELIREQSRARIIMILLVLVFGICSVVQSKLRWYIVPLYPALAILISSLVVDALKDSKSIAFSSLATAAFVITLMAPSKIVLIFGLAGLAVVLHSLTLRKISYRPAAFVICSFLVITGGATLWPLYRGTETPVARLAGIAGNAYGGTRSPLIVSSDVSKPAPLFYSNRSIEIAKNSDDLARFILDRQMKEIILPAKDIEALSALYSIVVLEEAGPLVYATIRPLGVQ